jgi:2-dehydro-3-deoxygalactonokinase
VTARCIGLDWGTSSLRAYLLAADGGILERRHAEAGILAVKDGAFDAAMESLIGDWDLSLPVLASGMITSRQGWVEVPYVACPGGAAALAAGLVERRSERGRNLHFVPGMRCLSGDGVPDVMRGEEVQVLGAMAAGPQLFVAPGTHSKWIDADGGLITRFSTYMTGEAFAVLRQHSILGRLMTGEADDAAAFERGARMGLAEPEGLLHTLFSVRTLGLFEKLPAASLASYLSGLLIGTETGHAIRSRPAARRCVILGAERLAALYGSVLRLAGLESKPADADVAVRGLHGIAVSRGLVP